MKDEFGGRIIIEFVGLRSKMYYLVDLDGEENKKAKGVNKSVVRGIRHKKFDDVLFGRKVLKVNCIELELMIFLRFHCLILMIKDIY